jgi:hypothetical protein
MTLIRKGGLTSNRRGPEEIARFASIAKIAEIERQTLPLINADDADPERIGDRKPGSQQGSAPNPPVYGNLYKSAHFWV